MNCLLADNSHTISSLILTPKSEKISQKLSLVDALRVNSLIARVGKVA